MRCEPCTKKWGYREIAHGIRFGTTDHRTEMSIPDKELAATILYSKVIWSWLASGYKDIIVGEGEYLRFAERGLLW